MDDINRPHGCDLIWKIWEIEPLVCVTCGTEMELKFLVDEALRCP